jgi:hypothetical protein
MDGLEALYEHLTRNSRKGVRNLSEGERRDYMARAAREHRKRQREAIDGGSPEPTVSNVRAALADAALALLATDAPGADGIRRVLDQVFGGRPGVSGTVSAKARAGRLKPRLLKSK